MAAFLEHVSLVMEASEAEGAERVSLMTLHAAKGLEFDTVFLPGWEDGLFPNQRALDESGRAGLEEERRLAHVGLTRARERAKLSFAVNRRIHGLWSSTTVALHRRAAARIRGRRGGTCPFSAGASRFDRNPQPFGSSYATPGWQTGAGQTGGRGFAASPGRRGGAIVGSPADRGRADRQVDGHALEIRRRSAGVPHQVRPRHVAGVDGNKMTVDFDKAAGRWCSTASFRRAEAEAGVGGATRGQENPPFCLPEAKSSPASHTGEQSCGRPVWCVRCFVGSSGQRQFTFTGHIEEPGTSMSHKKLAREEGERSRSSRLRRFSNTSR